MPIDSFGFDLEWINSVDPDLLLDPMEGNIKPNESIGITIIFKGTKTIT
jgi:hypothetical protein